MDGRLEHHAFCLRLPWDSGEYNGLVLKSKPPPEFALEHGPLEMFTPILTRG
jgi:hypothetical protein